MSHQYIEETLASYFDELLNEPPTEAPVKEAEPPAIASDKVTQVKQPPAVETTPLSKAATSIDENVPTKYPQANKPKETVSITEEKIQKPTAVEKKAEEHTVNNPIAVADSTTYEQHKRCLEKMLQQVSALEKPSSSDIEPPEKPVNTESDVIPELSEEELAQAAVVMMPPLSSEWMDNGRPHWAQERFDILLIEVNGLQLALPLVALGLIQPLDEQLTPLFGQSDWFMGLQKTPMGNIKTVDTARFVMPERYQSQHDYKYVVSISGLAWGLAVDRIHQPISVQPEDIRWRTKRVNRRWMAGTLKDHMCVLLDIPAMGEVLQGQDKNHHHATGA